MNLTFNIIAGFNELSLLLLRLAFPLCFIHSKPAWWSSCIFVSHFLDMVSVTSSLSCITPSIHLCCCLFYSTVLYLSLDVFSFLNTRFCLTTTSLTRRRRKEAHFSDTSKSGWQTRNSVLRPRIDIPYLLSANRE